MRSSHLFQLAFLPLVACGGGTAPATSGQGAAGGPGADPAVVPSEVRLGEGVVAVELACAEERPESCNAVDDNCDGAIDEGCGYASGALQVTAAWATPADVDLVVAGPAEDPVGGENQESADGGKLDRASGCGAQDHVLVENAVWETAAPGRYRVELQHRGVCSEPETAVVTTVTLSAGGRVLGTFNKTLSPTERAHILTVELR